MKKALCAAILSAALLSGPGAQAGAGEERFLAAKEAARSGDIAQLNRLAAIARTENAPLDAYVTYWALSQRLARREALDAELDAFVAAEDGNLIAERARADWIRAAGRAGRWPLVAAQTARLRNPDNDMLCWGWLARLANGDASVLDDAQSLWESTAAPGEACSQMLNALAVRKPPQSFWQRARRLVDARRIEAAKATLARLPQSEAPEGEAVSEALDQPLRYLSRADTPRNRKNRELMVLSLSRLAQSDYRVATGFMASLNKTLTAEDRAYLSGILGWQAARTNLPEARTWFRTAGSAPMIEEQRAWQVRAALRLRDWREILRAIDAMPPSQRTLPEWVYWHGRALLETGQARAGREELTQIAGQPNFYGILAGEELGQSFTVPPGAKPPTAEELAQADAHIAVRRARMLIQLDSRMDAIREWNWGMRGADDRFLLASAELARREQLYDRAIAAADRTIREHDYALRYLAPFYDKVEPAARRWGLELYWVYGLMRQESRFVPATRSSAGAVGLMQVMPSTARFVAQKIGLTGYHSGEIESMDTNLILGTAYLRMMMDRLDGQPALASAAYNAGPGRIRRWCGALPVEGAIFAETIPIGETRDYVKKVMANTVIYATLLTGKPQSLKSRMGIITFSGASPNTTALALPKSSPDKE